MLTGLMGSRHWTTEQLDDMLGSFGYRCPDGLPRSLQKMREFGVIEGRYDESEGCWLWWAPKD